MTKIIFISLSGKEKFLFHPLILEPVFKLTEFRTFSLKWQIINIKELISVPKACANSIFYHEGWAGTASNDLGEDAAWAAERLCAPTGLRSRFLQTPTTSSDTEQSVTGGRLSQTQHWSSDTSCNKTFSLAWKCYSQRFHSFSVFPLLLLNLYPSCPLPLFHPVVLPVFT